MINEKEWRQWFSASLKKIMESRGVSQRELSDGIGVTEAAVSRYVNGNRSPDANVIKRMAVFLHCRCDDLVMPQEGSENDG